LKEKKTFRKGQTLYQGEAKKPHRREVKCQKNEACPVITIRAERREASTNKRKEKTYAFRLKKACKERGHKA